MIAATELKILARGLAPCCDFRPVLPLSARQAAVSLAHDELRLAVTDTATAGGAAGKTRLLAPNPGPHPQTLPPAQTGALASLATGCEARCRRLAAREGLLLPTAVNWAAPEAEGHQSRFTCDVRSSSVPPSATPLSGGSLQTSLSIWSVRDSGFR